MAAEVVERDDTPLDGAATVRSDNVLAAVPAEVDDLVRARHVRLVRGFAGTGKTDVLIWRVRWLRQEFPDLRILVTTFNKPIFEQRLKPEIDGIADVETFETICAEVFKKKHGRWVEPQDTLGLVRHMTDEFPDITNLGADFLADEFIWMKETGRTQRDKYVTEQRLGAQQEAAGAFRLRRRKTSSLSLGPIKRVLASYLHTIGLTYIRKPYVIFAKAYRFDMPTTSYWWTRANI